MEKSGHGDGTRAGPRRPRRPLCGRRRSGEALDVLEPLEVEGVVVERVEDVDDVVGRRGDSLVQGGDLEAARLGVAGLQLGAGFHGETSLTKGDGEIRTRGRDTCGAAPAPQTALRAMPLRRSS